MKPKFEVILLGEVWDLLDAVDEKSKDKILYNIDKAKYVNDPELFKKLDELIWEFRTKYKKTDKIPKAEIEKARAIMKQYFEQKFKK